MREDKRGLWVEVPIDDTSYGRDIVASLRSGALDGQSFRFSVKAEKWDDPKDPNGIPTRTIREVELFEFGPVTFPAYEATSAGVRSRDAYAAWRMAHPLTTDTAPGPATADPTAEPVSDTSPRFTKKDIHRSFTDLRAYLARQQETSP